MKKFFVVALLATFFLINNIKSQVIEAPPKPGAAWVTEHVPNRKPVPLPHLREADVLWAKRIWRIIDLREKINLPLYYPTEPTNGRINLVTVLINEMKDFEKNQVYAYADEFFLEPLSKEQLQQRIAPTKTITAEREDGTKYDTTITKPIGSDQVKMIRVVEDWFIDKQRSLMEVRIRAICPIIEELDDQGEVKGTRPIFWLYYDDIRSILVRFEVYNRHNDGGRMSYDDVFLKRFFSSYIYKESNVYDRLIVDYAKGLDALLESERIKEEIFLMEHDLWEY